MTKLICISGSNIGDEYELPEGALTLGRSMQNSISIVDEEVSRYHCKIIVKATQVYVEDLKSTNGTFVNDAKVEGTVPFYPGDNLRIGVSVLQIYSDTFAKNTQDQSTRKGSTAEMLKYEENMLKKTTMQVSRTTSLRRPLPKGGKLNKLSFFKTDDDDEQ